MKICLVLTIINALVKISSLANYHASIYTKFSSFKNNRVRTHVALSFELLFISFGFCRSQSFFWFPGDSTDVAHQSQTVVIQDISNAAFVLPNLNIQGRPCNDSPWISPASKSKWFSSSNALNYSIDKKQKLHFTDYFVCRCTCKALKAFSKKQATSEKQRRGRINE